jgi:hypothetical protein
VFLTSNYFELYIYRHSTAAKAATDPNMCPSLSHKSMSRVILNGRSVMTAKNALLRKAEMDVFSRARARTHAHTHTHKALKGQSGPGNYVFRFSESCLWRFHRTPWTGVRSTARSIATKDKTTRENEHTATIRNGFEAMIHCPSGTREQAFQNTPFLIKAEQIQNFVRFNPSVSRR